MHTVDGAVQYAYERANPGKHGLSAGTAESASSAPSSSAGPGGDAQQGQSNKQLATVTSRKALFALAADEFFPVTDAR